MTGRNPGRYESHYLRAVDPVRPRGAWIRHTTHQRPGAAATGALWCTVWDPDAGPPYVVKQSLAGPPPARFAASAEALGRAAAWDLVAAGEGPPLRHLPRAWMYRAPLPRTKPESPLPDAVFTGWIDTAGRRTEVAGWRGMVGHNWGSEHAERWVWLHGVAFAEAPGAWIDVVLGRVRVGGVLTPWVANGALALDGRRYRLGGLRRPRVDAGVGSLEADLPGSGAAVTVRVVSPDEQTVAFRYADPAVGSTSRSTARSRRCTCAWSGRGGRRWSWRPLSAVPMSWACAMRHRGSPWNRFRILEAECRVSRAMRG